MDTATRLLEVFAEPRPLLDGVKLVGDPIAVLPVGYHLMWRHVLGADLSAPLNEMTEVGCWGQEP